MNVRRIRPDEYHAVLDLVRRSFEECDSGSFTDTACRSFLEYADFTNFSFRQRHNYETFVILEGSEICGMMELKSRIHISMLFVDPKKIRCGYGTVLVRFAEEYCAATRPFARAITVNASPTATGFYEKLGFTRLSDSPNVSRELLSYPMSLRITSKREPLREVFSHFGM
ncbi:MAG: GNAT family N-acetyltransferase [Oscillospiraceae bacterium]|jgi:ribosomal protein S18 acetylase RimI-like enzyme